MNKFNKRFDKIMEGCALDKIEKLQEEINHKQEQLDEMKLTAGMMKGFSKTANIAKTCDDCGFGVPKYSGRYPKHCPNCDGDMSVPNDVPLDEAAKRDMKGMAQLIIKKGGKNISTADFEKFGIPFELFLRMTTKPDVLVKNAKKLLGEAVELADKVRATFRTPVLTKDGKNAVVKQGAVLKVVDSTLKDIKGSDGKMKEGMVLYKNTKGEELYIDASDIHAYMREK